MAYYSKYNLTNQTPVQTYENLVQFTTESSSFTNGVGNEFTSSVNVTSSWANISLSSSYGLKIPAIQAGVTSLLSSSTGSIITFSSPMPNTNYVVNLTASGSGYLTGSRISGPLTVNGFTASFYTASLYLMWSVIGTT